MREDAKALRAAGGVGAAILLSRILGLVREQVLAYLFGAGNATDAFNVAFRIPNLLRNLFAEGAMSASLVPSFTRARIEEGEERAWRLAGLVLRILIVFGGGLALVGMVFARGFVGVYADAFRDVPGKFELTIRLTRLLLPFFPMIAASAALMALLNACGSFFLPALSLALFNLVSIGSGAALAILIARGHDLGLGLSPIEGMAIGFLLGGLAQGLFQLPQLYRKGYRFAASRGGPAWHRDPALRRMLGLMAPAIAGLAATQISVLVNTWLATSQGPGAVSWLNYAFRLVQFPIGVFGVSIATAALPSLSRGWVEKDAASVRALLTRALRNVLAINLPAAAGLAFLAVPIVELLFQHGRFQASDSRATALALAMYAIGLPAYSAVKLLAPACYAMGRSRAAVSASVIAVVAGSALSVVFVRTFGFWGLALGTSAGAVLNGLLLLGAVRDWIDVRALTRSFMLNLAVALGMGIAVFLSHRALAPFPSLFRVGIPVIFGVLIVAAADFVLGLGPLLR